MRYIPKVVLAVAAVALLTATFFAANVHSRATDSRQTQTVTVKAGEKPASFEETIRNDEVVGMTAMKPGGGRLVLNAQSNATCATSCPAGQKLSCWEDEEQLMSICVCGTAGKKVLTVKKYLDKS
jgi:hypothetical protein